MSTLKISNNVIYGVNATYYVDLKGSLMGLAIGTVGNSCQIFTTTGGINLYFNRVSMAGSTGVGSLTNATAAIYIGSDASDLDFRNNVLANSQVATNVG